MALSAGAALISFFSLLVSLLLSHEASTSAIAKKIRALDFICLCGLQLANLIYLINLSYLHWRINADANQFNRAINYRLKTIILFLQPLSRDLGEEGIFN